MEHTRLAYWILCKAQEHVAVLRNNTFGIQRAVQVNLLVLYDQKKTLLAVGNIWRAELQWWAEEDGVCIAFMATEPPMSISTEDMRRGHLHHV